MGSSTDVALSGTSLPAPNVQEMVRNDPLQVPQRYFRNEVDVPKDGDTCHDRSSEVPIIDFSLISIGHKEELKKLDLACKQWGFFQMVNHGVAREVMERMKDSAAKFFELPLEEKNKISMPLDEMQGYGHASVVSEDQILEWSDRLILAVHPSKYRNPKVWPPTPFKEAIDTYTSEVRKVGGEVLKSISLIMGMEKDALLGLHRELVQALSVGYYPPCSMPDKVLGLTPHSDICTFTILMQDNNNVTGLQFKHDGKWVPVTPISDAFLVNVADNIEILSNGKYMSVEHRVVTTETKARMSYASFFFPRHDVEIEPLEHIVLESPGSVRKYKKVTFGNYQTQALKNKIDGKAHTEFAKIGS